MNEKVLVVDDEEEILSLISDALSDDGYVVFTAKDCDEALEKLKINPDIILLDVMMPGKNGFEFCTEIRDAISCPIIFITAKINEADLLKGLAIGGDDYITKPFSIRGLKARIGAHIRRDKRNFSMENKKYIIFNDLKIDLKGRKVLLKDEEVILTKREFDIIELLALNNGQVFSKEQIYEKIWGYDAEGDSSTVAEHIKKIRFKFNKHNISNKYISTVWGVGYKWEN
ncbi:response regulator transcription factor [Clostridium senegalense]|uniref:Stage 0 sporulation protein A homolog n=1 Tax=Clostridium senegalense TaxID=1465809 RepID=A0A6M0H396_9CLOT|nr:response regulator transcription factor [Clostridium senegalense]NEU05226.1 response regulator transcription factor [Clostridium senegalense]